LEKHIILDRAAGGPDSAFSLEPAEFRQLVLAVRETEDAIGRVRYGASPSEEHSMAFRRSLFVVEDIAAGSLLTADNVRSIRPAGGLHPRHLGDIIGRRATRALRRGTPLDWSMIESP
jgi:sialic acid synthase SpsE